MTTESVHPGRGRSGSGAIIESLGEQQSLRARVTEVLREAMVAGELEPGVVYSAPALAQTLGVSATPVREAMMELAQEGLVETLRHRGYRMKEVSAKTLSEITDLREMIEVPAVGRAVGAVTEADLRHLRATADELDATAMEGELRAFITADMVFHLRLLAVLGNQVLVDEVRRLRGMTRLYGLRRLSEQGDLVDTAHEHHQLLDHIEAGDREAAEALMRQHLRHITGVWAGNVQD